MLEMVQGKVERFTDYHTFHNRPNSSACIGSDNGGQGTFGGYLQDVKTSSTYGLISGHVAFPQVEINGRKSSIRAYSTNNNITITQPSTRHLHEDIQDCQNEINAIEGRFQSDEDDVQKLLLDEFLTAKVALETALKSNKFGIVEQGEVTIEDPNKAAIDWALIKLEPGRVGINSIRMVSKSQKTWDAGKLKVSKIADADSVWKDGHMTGFRTGTVGALKSVTRIEGKTSKEQTVIGREFSSPGDSGAWVADSVGICGVVTGGCEQEFITYVTDFQYLLDAIERRSGLKLKLV